LLQDRSADGVAFMVRGACITQVLLRLIDFSGCLKCLQTSSFSGFFWSLAQLKLL
jgi:hypothetical protein